LKSRKQIDALFTSGKKLNVAPFRVYYSVLPAAETPLRFGIGVSSKVFKKAVDRNRVKRLARECWRLQKSSLADICRQQQVGILLFIVYTARETGEFKELYTRMEKVIEQLKAVVQKN
jgi:ribonuclease P protein component